MANERRKLPAGMDPARYKLGQATFRKVFGQERDMSEALEFDYLSVEHVYGRIWSRNRGSITLRDRSFITVAINAATRHGHELAIHFRAARNQGLSGEEILGILLLVGEAAGPDALHDALKVAREMRQPIAMRELTPRLSPAHERLVRLALLFVCGTEEQVAAYYERRKRELKTGAARAKAFEQIVEMTIHVAHYAGWPAGHNGLRPARSVFRKEYLAALKG